MPAKTKLAYGEMLLTAVPSRGTTVKCRKVLHPATEAGHNPVS